MPRSSNRITRGFMSVIAPVDQLRLALHRAGRLTRKLRLGAVSGPIGRFRVAGGGRSQLLIAPPDLRTADPTVAVEIYSGRFAFAGHVVEVGGRSPFHIGPPSEDWLRELHSFGWLRHLRAADTPLARSNARTIVEDWLRMHSRATGEVVWDADVTARRALSFLAQSPLILHDADHDLYRDFVRSLLRHASMLRSAVGTSEPGLPRLHSAIAIALIGLSLSQQERLARSGLDRIDAELQTQILPDGGHISRNPTAIVDILIDLLPLRQALIARGLIPSETLMNSIDRMMPMLRFFRHGDGAFAHFNGAVTSASGLVATLVSYDETLGTPAASATYSGYERIESGAALLLADAGGPPPIAYSSEAHAGALSIEFSHGMHRIIINCGAPAARHENLRRAARRTAAHSTAVLEEQSSCRFSSPSANAQIVSGPRSLAAHRQSPGDGSTVLQLSHDGYARRFGLVHERSLRLGRDGHTLEGMDRFSGQPSARDLSFVARFHLHHAVSVHSTGRETALDLRLSDGTIWRFEANGPVELEESVHLSDVFGSRPSHQLVLASAADSDAPSKWRLSLMS
ncbi:MAG: heparinase II/III family protein [Propylenella sp.]